MEHYQQANQNEKDCQERDGGKDFFNKHEISQADWELVKKLNNIIGVSTFIYYLIGCFSVHKGWLKLIQEFYYITKKMEGDTSSACQMLSE